MPSSYFYRPISQSMTEYKFVTRWTDLYIKTYTGELLIQSFGANLILGHNEP